MPVRKRHSGTGGFFIFFLSDHGVVVAVAAEVSESTSLQIVTTL